MNTRIAVLGLMAVLVGSAVRADEPTLKEFTSKEGRFSVMMPETPKEVKRGDQIQYVVDQGSKAYLASYQDIANLANADAGTLKLALEAGRDAAAKSFNGKVLSSKEVKLGDNPGIEFQVDAPGLGIYRARMYMVSGRLYQIVVLGPKEFATSKTSDKYLESFKLTK